MTMVNTGRNYHRGFTILELIVCVIVVFLLLLLLVPSARTLLATARTSMCQSNLHQLDSIAAPFKVKSHTNHHQLQFGWVSLLYKHIQSSEVFMCPEDQKPTIAPETYVRVTSRGKHLYDMAMEPGPLTIIKNASGEEGMPGYNYELWFEDIRPTGGDMDFNDLVLKVEVLDETDISVTFKSISAGYHFDIFNGEEERVMRDLGRSAKRGASIITQGRTSYANNSNIWDQLNPPPSRTIFLMDYDYVTLADPYSHDWYNPNPTLFSWLDDEGDITFARHHHQANVLFNDGSVKKMDPAEIDPNSIENARSYWGEDY